MRSPKRIATEIMLALAALVSAYGLAQSKGCNLPGFDPEPLGPLTVVVLRESGEQSGSISNMLTNARSKIERGGGTFRGGNTFRVWDDEQPAAESWLPVFDGAKLPAVAIVARGKLLALEPLPEDETGLLELVGRFEGG